MQATPMMSIGNVASTPAANSHQGSVEGSGFEKFLVVPGQQQDPGESPDIDTEGRLLAFWGAAGGFAQQTGNAAPQLTGNNPDSFRDPMLPGLLTTSRTSEAKVPGAFLPLREKIFQTGIAGPYAGENTTPLTDENGGRPLIAFPAEAVAYPMATPTRVRAGNTASSRPGGLNTPLTSGAAAPLPLLQEELQGAQIQRQALQAPGRETWEEEGPLSNPRFGNPPGRLTHVEPKQTVGTMTTPPLRIQQGEDAVPALPREAAATGEKNAGQPVHSREQMSLQQGLTHEQPGQVAAWIPHNDKSHPAPLPAPTPPTSVTLPSGHQVDERGILDQVAGHIRGSNNGHEGQAVLRLHPSELGEVKLELRIDHDRVSAQLHTQTIQVQEVLERHLPRLRDALEQQGLQIDSLNVNIDAGQRDNGARNQQFADQYLHERPPEPYRAPSAPPSASSVQNAATHRLNQRSGSGSGISLRV